MRGKEPLECRRMHIWALKMQKLPGPLSAPWTPSTKGSLCYVGNFRPRKLGPPLDKILDPHLNIWIIILYIVITFSAHWVANAGWLLVTNLAAMIHSLRDCTRASPWQPNSSFAPASLGPRASPSSTSPAPSCCPSSWRTRHWPRVRNGWLSWWWSRLPWDARGSRGRRTVGARCCTGTWRGPQTGPMCTSRRTLGSLSPERDIFFNMNASQDQETGYLWERSSEIVGIVLPVGEIFWHCFTCERDCLLFYLWERFSEIGIDLPVRDFLRLSVVLLVREIFWDWHWFTCERFSEIVCCLTCERDFLRSALIYLWEILWDYLLFYLWEIFWYGWHCLPVRDFLRSSALFYLWEIFWDHRHCFTCDRFSEIISIVLPVRDFLRS